jgi:WD40 repeat protein
VADNGDRTVNVVDAQTGRTMRELGPHAAGVTRIAISPDSRTIATKDLMGRFYLWHAASGQLLFSFVTAEGAGAEEITFSPDGAWLAYRGEWNELNLLPLHP